MRKDEESRLITAGQAELIKSMHSTALEECHTLDKHIVKKIIKTMPRNT